MKMYCISSNLEFRTLKFTNGVTFMALGQKIECKKREIKSKGFLNQMKAKDFVPGIIYGQGQEAQPVFLAGREFSRIIDKHGIHGLFSLQMEGEAKPAMALVKELQKHPLNGSLVHVDFLTVNMNEKIHSTVTIYIHGEDEVINKGGILQAGAKEIEVSCMPQDLPEHLTVDVSELEIGHKIVAGDLQVPQGVEMISDPDTVIATVLVPSRASIETQEESEEQAEAEKEAE
jgi:large subunit ribosomal protein L25